MKLINTDANGRITSTVNPQPGTEDLYIGYVEAEPPMDATHYRNGEFLTQPASPSSAHDWDDAAFVWVLNLAAAKAQARDVITTARNNEERNGFFAYGKLFDSDSLAIQRISVAAQAAQVVGETFSIEWTCADNSGITLDYAQMLSLPLLMAQAANVLHVKARDLKAQIDVAITLEEIEAITW